MDSTWTVDIAQTDEYGTVNILHSWDIKMLKSQSNGGESSLYVSYTAVSLTK